VLKTNNSSSGRIYNKFTPFLSHMLLEISAIFSTQLLICLTWSWKRAGKSFKKTKQTLKIDLFKKKNQMSFAYEAPRSC